MPPPSPGDRGANGPPAYRPRRPDIRDTRRWSQFGYHNRRLRELVRTLISRSGIGPGADVVDYGCADMPYRSELPPGVRYVGADLPGNAQADVVLGADGRLPLPDASADLVLSTQVLEHVDDPALYLAECARVLRPGGTLVVSTHGIMYFHPDPADHWRWTRTGLTRQLEAAGLEVVSVHGVMGLAAAAVQLFQDATIAYLPGVLRRPYALAMQALIAVCDRRYRAQARADNGLVLAALAARPARGAP